MVCYPVNKAHATVNYLQNYQAATALPPGCNTSSLSSVSNGASSKAMSYRVSELKGVAGILLARRACASSGLDREQQKGFYKKCGELLQPLSFKVHKLAGDGTELDPKEKSVDAGHVLSRCKINDEESDPQTRLVLDCLALVSSRLSAGLAW